MSDMSTIDKRLKRLLLCVFAVTLSCSTANASSEQVKSPEQKKYESCTTLVNTNPAQSVSVSESWVAEYPSFSSRHCRALAYFANKRYGDAERELKEISSTVSADKSTVAASLLMQSADAAAADNRINDGIANLTFALSILVDTTNAQDVVRNILTKRSSLLSQEGKLQAAIQDIEHAMTLSSDKSELHVSRARIYMALGMDDEAGKDLKLALEYKPENQAVSTMLVSVQRKKQILQ